ncbi:hypothetical protein HDE_14254 [Halotydeus destructor]|nr:hypothetical protein HDE_14254 [Halotydeus destructor]
MEPSCHFAILFALSVAILSSCPSVQSAPAQLQEIVYDLTQQMTDCQQYKYRVGNTWPFQYAFGLRCGNSERPEGSDAQNGDSIGSPVDDDGHPLGFSHGFGRGRPFSDILTHGYFPASVTLNNQPTNNGLATSRITIIAFKRLPVFG